MLSNRSGFSIPSLTRNFARDVGLSEYLDPLLSDETEETTTFETQFESDQLIVTVDDYDWDLADSTECRRVVIEALTDRTADKIVVETESLEYRYSTDAVALFAAAGRFRRLASDRNERLARQVVTDPLEVATELDTRVGPMADLGHASGLIEAAKDINDYHSMLSPTVGFTIGCYYVDHSIPAQATLRDVTTLGAKRKARVYTRPDGVSLYALDIPDLSLSPEQRARVVDAYEAIVYGDVTGDLAPLRAIEHVSDDPADPVVTSILEKHTEGYGILEDFFADSRVSDVYATSPVESNPLRVVVDGESMRTNVFLSQDGTSVLSSRIRRTSGRAFSRATPTVDATASLTNGTDLRIAGITDPVVEGVAFAFRDSSDDRFTLPMLVKNGTMTAEAAGFLSVAIERNAAALVAGTRGAGKTTLLGTLLYELSPETRTVVIEDTPELPVKPLQSVDRDVQALRTGTGEGPEISADDALRTALRIGDGALVVGEVRGEEAPVLYEAMRVGANANAVLGTIHGDGADDVYERVVSDLGVPSSSFAATDLVVTMQTYNTPAGSKRRLASIEGVSSGENGITFEPLYQYDGETISSTGKLERGRSRAANKLTRPSETYSDLLNAVSDRSTHIETLARDGRIAPAEVTRAYTRRRSG